MVDWTAWAILVVTLGAFNRLTAQMRNPIAWTCGDVYLVAVGLLTVEKLQGLKLLDIVYVGVSFVMFAFCGTQLMRFILKRFVRDDTRGIGIS